MEESELVLPSVQVHSESNDESVFVADLPREVVFAALFDVARSSGMGWFAYDGSEADLDLTRAAAFLEKSNGCLRVSEYRGRRMHAAMRDGWLDATTYNEVNAGGLPLAQTVVARLRCERAAKSGLPVTSRLVGHWAREALYGLSPAMAWRNTEPHNPEPPYELVGKLLSTFDERAMLHSTIARSALIECLRRNYRLAVQAWVRVDERLYAQRSWGRSDEHAHGDPLDPISTYGELVKDWQKLVREGESLLDDDALAGVSTRKAMFFATTDARARKAVTGENFWDQMPPIWGDALVEHTLKPIAPRKLVDRSASSISERTPATIASLSR